MLLLWRPSFTRYLGIDLAESLVARARAAVQAQGFANVHIEQGTAEGRLPPSGFNLVILSGVLNLLHDDLVAPTLREASQALLPGGLLFLRNNCSNSATFFRPSGPAGPPCMYRTGEDYRTAVAEIETLEIIAERFLFAPLCMPNLVYYHLLPQRLCTNPSVARILDAWFRYEERTSEHRLQKRKRLYPIMLRAIRKPTAFRVLIARRRYP